jgi:phosphatidylglycerophosphate synthase
MRFAASAGSHGERLAQAAAGGRGPLLALACDTVVDPRVLAHLARVGGAVALVAGEGAGRGAVLRLEGPLPDAARSAPDLVAAAERSIAAGASTPFDAAGFDAHIRNLRRELEPYVIPVRSPADRERVERFLFWSNYKGSTDFLTRWVWPPFVWLLLRPLARARVHPNWVTGLSIAATLAAVPLFARGAWIPGLALAYLMSMLDSVDGKLARLTFTASRLGDVLDHGLDIVHPPFWYLAWAWGLSGADPTSGVVHAAYWLFGLYVFDRLLAPLFLWRTGRSIHGYEPVDVRLRTFISRRNVNLPVFTLALPLGLGVPAFYAILAWQGASATFHAVRLVQCWNRGA